MADYVNDRTDATAEEVASKTFNVETEKKNHVNGGAAIPHWISR